MGELPLFPVTTVGSWPRPPIVVEAHRRLRLGEIDDTEFDRLVDPAVAEVIRVQERAGCDVVTDGELRRDNFYSFVARRLDGVQLMTLAEMLDVVEDKAGFEQLLQSLDVPAYAISNPTCVGRIARRQALARDELRFVQQHTTRPVKVTLPGPYLLTRAMFVSEVTRHVYPSKEALADDVVGVLQEELRTLARHGAAFVQLDEPVLTELAFGRGRTRTFMCAALAARSDPAEELEFAVTLINRVAGTVPDLHVSLHVCRGNWSRNEDTLLRGSYDPLVPYLERLAVDQLVLEYATDRAGPVVRIGDQELGLGVVNPRTDRVERPEEVEAKVRQALRVYPPKKIFLNPDCGFATFLKRPMNGPALAEAKMTAMADAADRLRRAG